MLPFLKALIGYRNNRPDQREKEQSSKASIDRYGLVVVCSKLCIGPNRLPVRHGIREIPKNSADSGWMLVSGNEGEDFSKNPSNYVLVPLDRMIESDPSLKLLYDQPIGTELTRENTEEPWRWIIDDVVVEHPPITGSLKKG